MTADTDKTTRAEAFLKQTEQEGRGHLTIFLGAAAGVGKTCAMLKAAHNRLEEGVDVVIGMAVSHGRKYTESLLKGLPVIPEKELTYKGSVMKETNLEAILQRRPKLVVIDELAHTNVPGSRYKYRYQDVEEILEAGIDVYTAVNIQHLESLNDVVAHITETVVRETVPDEFIAKADEIQLIDIPPTELQKRLQEGKIYAPEQASRALRSFFRKGNISALRELALRYTASAVDEDTTEYMRRHDIKGPWPASGKVMVCAGSSPFAAQLIRSGHRLARGLHSELLVATVETPDQRFPVGDRERERIWKNLRLAEKLGGRVLNIFGEDVAETLLEAARANNVSAIIIGKSGPRRLKDYFVQNIVDRLIENSGPIHVYVIQAAPENDYSTLVETEPVKKQESNVLRQGMLSFLMVSIITVLMYTMSSYVELVNVALLYLLPVLVSAMWWGRKASYFTAALSILAFEYFFLEPVYTFMIDDIRYLWSFVIFFAVSFAVGRRTEKLRQEIVLTAKREHEVTDLYQFSRNITALDNTDEIIKTFLLHVGGSLSRNVFVLLENNGRKPKLAGAYDVRIHDLNSQYLLSQDEESVGYWCMEHGRIAGRSTDTLPTAQYIYFPLTGSIKAAVGIDLDSNRLSPEERNMLEAWISLLNMMLQKAVLSEQAREADLLKQSDNLRTALFNSVSHELRTPLAGIMGAVYTMQEKHLEYSSEMFEQLLDTISECSSRMERIITNLLDTARIESGMVKLKSDWCDMEDVVSGALRKWGSQADRCKLICDLPEDLPLFIGDCGLLEHVALNFLDNAAKYSGPGSEIRVKGWAEDGRISLSVTDNGCGFSDDDKPYLFDKFFRARCTDKYMGTGLGLAICRSIVEAHGGAIWAEHRKDGQGSVFGFTLPLKRKEQHGEKAGMQNGRE